MPKRRRLALVSFRLPDQLLLQAVVAARIVLYHVLYREQVGMPPAERLLASLWVPNADNRHYFEATPPLCREYFSYRFRTYIAMLLES